jgi:starch phosphorylase
MTANTLSANDAADYEALAELALDLRWSWNHAADNFWQQLAPDLWALAQNPWVILHTVSRQKIRALLAQPDFRQRLDELLAAKRQAEQCPRWFQSEYPSSALNTVAYFSMEYMLSEALPIYSGGLGNVAGDQLKAASDLGVPVVAVGLLYAQGYFRQEINLDGHQEALYPFNDPGQLPIKPLRGPDGEWLRLQLDLSGCKLWIRAWEAQVGRLKLYLLDTNDPQNLPAHRCITTQLYGGGPELRLKQEIVLGIGGWRLLRLLGLNPEVCHLNEGHAAFTALERARGMMVDMNISFELALTIGRSGTIFTTHTAVEAGFDRFAPALIEKYLKAYAENDLGLSLDELLALGRRDRNNGWELFNMAYLAVRTSGTVNGVSQLHGEVSREIFQDLFPRWPQVEVPVGHVTNGIHVPTWDSAAADQLWTEACGKERWRGTMDDVGQKMRTVSDARLWRFRSEARQGLVQQMRDEYGRQLAEEGASPDDVNKADAVFDADILTLGFARRFALYKRPTLLLHDPERLVRLLCNHERPVQLVLSGKAHPQDGGGQALIKQWLDFAKRPEVASRVMFLSDYDMLQAQKLVQGVDLWINTPLRPWEACGTSGMKVLVNGGLNLSELDGWWAEAYAPEVGWAIGDRQEHHGDPRLDGEEADEVYRLLEDEIIPEFYNRGPSGIPAEWIKKVRESMARLTPQFSANRAVRDYTERFYLPAAAAYIERAAVKGQAAATLLQWRQEISRNWEHVRFGDMAIKTSADGHSFSAQVYLGALTSDAVRVELYANPADGKPVIEPMQESGSLVGSCGGYLFTATIPADRIPSDYTPRVTPFHGGVAVPLEAGNVCWQR